MPGTAGNHPPASSTQRLSRHVTCERRHRFRAASSYRGEGRTWAHRLPYRSHHYACGLAPIKSRERPNLRRADHQLKVAMPATTEIGPVAGHAVRGGSTRRFAPQVSVPRTPVWLMMWAIPVDLASEGSFRNPDHTTRAKASRIASSTSCRVAMATYQEVAVAASAMPCASSQRSASMAALQPSAAAVTAWR